MIEKLTHDNFLLWKAHVLPQIRGTQLMGFLDGSWEALEEEIEVIKADKTIKKVSNPAYVAWVTQDQHIMGFLLSSLPRDALAQVVELTTANKAWVAIQSMYSS